MDRVLQPARVGSRVSLVSVARWTCDKSVIRRIKIHVGDDERGEGDHDCHPRALAGFCADGWTFAEVCREGDEQTEPRNVLLSA
jgi:hypothetical protein